MDQRLLHFGVWRGEPYQLDSKSDGWHRFRLREYRPKLSILRIFVLTLLVGGPYWYYTNCLRIRYFEDPLQGLVFVEEASTPQLNEFCKATVAKILDPTLVELEKLRVLRKSTRNGTFSSPELEQGLAKVRAQAHELLVEARLRRIPLKFKKDYTQSFLALHDLLRSVNVLEDALECSSEEERRKLYNESVKYAKMSKRKCEQARGYFASWKALHCEGLSRDGDASQKVLDG